MRHFLKRKTAEPRWASAACGGVCVTQTYTTRLSTYLKRTDGGTVADHGMCTWHGVQLIIGTAAAGRGSDYRRAARRMRQLAWRTHLTAADISPPPSRHLPSLL